MEKLNSERIEMLNRAIKLSQELAIIWQTMENPPDGTEEIVDKASILETIFSQMLQRELNAN